jgi:hypothetical protein
MNNSYKDLDIERCVGDLRVAERTAGPVGDLLRPVDHLLEFGVANGGETLASSKIATDPARELRTCGLPRQRGDDAMGRGSRGSARLLVSPEPRLVIRGVGGRGRPRRGTLGMAGGSGRRSETT